MRAAGAMGRFDVFGSLYVLTGPAHADGILDRIDPQYHPGAAVVSGPSRLPNDAGLIIRVLGTGSGPVKRRMRELWGIVRQQVMGVIDYGATEAGVVVLTVPCVVLFLVLQRHYVRGFMSGALKG